MSSLLITEIFSSPPPPFLRVKILFIPNRPTIKLKTCDIQNGILRQFFCLLGGGYIMQTLIMPFICSSPDFISCSPSTMKTEASPSAILTNNTIEGLTKNGENPDEERICTWHPKYVSADEAAFFQSMHYLYLQNKALIWYQLLHLRYKPLLFLGIFEYIYEFYLSFQSSEVKI